MVSINRGSVLEPDGRHSLCRSVPCSSDRMLQKSPSTGADTIIYDLEDSVAPAEKDSSRNRLAHFITTNTHSGPTPDRIAVRLNAINTPFFNNDISAVPRMALTVGVGTVLDSREVVVVVTGQRKSLALSKAIEEGVNHLVRSSILS